MRVISTGKPPLPPRQQEVLDFITSHIEGKGYAPSLREIGRHLGMKSTNGVDEVLGALEVKGFVRRAPFKARGIQVLAQAGAEDEPQSSYSEWVEDCMQARMAALDEEIAGLKARLRACTCGGGARP
jgi:SOS-response transcriptional repressor LexA